MIYTVLANIDQLVTRDVKLTVEADSEEHAFELSREALQVYPEPITILGSGNISRIVTEKAGYWIPRDITLRLEPTTNDD